MASPSVLGSVARISSLISPLAEPRHQLPDPQVVRADALQRIDRPAEDVIAPAELAGPLDRDDILGLLDDAEHLVGAAGSRQIRHCSDSATLKQVDAEAHLVLDPLQRVGQPR